MMPLPPLTSPVPLPVFMSSQSSIPSASTIPFRPSTDERKGDVSSSSKNGLRRDGKARSFIIPKLRLEIHDLGSPGSGVFLTSTTASQVLKHAVERVLTLLYLTAEHPHTTIPGTRSVTLILRAMEGVAYTTGSDLDDDHKEIHLSTDYVNGVDKSRVSKEIEGVLVHEMVHCFQYNAKNTCPGGLIEGIADWVRLNSDLAPPHWKREASGKWDAGYQHTAYFLNYLENRYGNGTISRMNEKLRTSRYEQKAFWTGLVGRPVEQLWNDYLDTIKAEAAEDEHRVLDRHTDEVVVVVEKAKVGQHTDGEDDAVDPPPDKT